MENKETLKKVLNQAFRDYTNYRFNLTMKADVVKGKIAGMVQMAFMLELITIDQHFRLVEIRKHIENEYKAFMESRDRDYPMAIRRQVENLQKYASEEIQKILGE